MNGGFLIICLRNGDSEKIGMWLRSMTADRENKESTVYDRSSSGGGEGEKGKPHGPLVVVG